MRDDWFISNLRNVIFIQFLDKVNVNYVYLFYFKKQGMVELKSRVQVIINTTKAKCCHSSLSTSNFLIKSFIIIIFFFFLHSGSMMKF